MTKIIAGVVGFFITLALLVYFTPANAGQNCVKGYVYSLVTKDCIKAVNDEEDRQDSSASGGLQWSGVSKSSCNQASKEMDGMMAQCRKYDKNQGGKSVEQCGKCCRQLREYSRRWQKCHNKGFAPPVAYATIRGSIQRLGCKWKI